MALMPLIEETRIIEEKDGEDDSFSSHGLLSVCLYLLSLSLSLSLMAFMMAMAATSTGTYIHHIYM